MKIVGIGGFVYPYSTFVHDSRLIQLFIHGQRLSKNFVQFACENTLKLGIQKNKSFNHVSQEYEQPQLH